MEFYSNESNLIAGTEYGSLSSDRVWIYLRLIYHCACFKPSFKVAPNCSSCHKIYTTMRWNSMEFYFNGTPLCDGYFPWLEFNWGFIVTKIVSLQDENVALPGRVCIYLRLTYHQRRVSHWINITWRASWSSNRLIAFGEKFDGVLSQQEQPPRSFVSLYLLTVTGGVISVPHVTLIL